MLSAHLHQAPTITYTRSQLRASSARRVCSPRVRCNARTPFEITGREPKRVFEHSVKLGITPEPSGQRRLSQVAAPTFSVQVEEAFDSRLVTITDQGHPQLLPK